MSSFFRNLTILDLSTVLAGPSVSQFFAELGANVIKVENIHSGGDVTRSWKLKSENKDSELSAYFISANWGKDSIAINLNADEGREIIYSLVKKSDIFLHNFKKNDDLKFKLDFETISAMNPSIIYANIVGFSEDSERTGYDAIIQAESGFISMNGIDDNLTHKMPVAMIDILAAHQLKEAILVALINKNFTKKITVSLFDSALSALANQASNYLNTGEVPKAIGSDHPNIVPYGSHFKCRDAVELIFAIGTTAQFNSLLKILGLDELLNDSRFVDNQSRVKHKAELKTILSKAIILIKSEELYQACIDKKIPVGRINDLSNVFNIKNATNVLLNKGSVKSVRQFIASNKNNKSVSIPPKLSENAAVILKKYLSFSDKKIIELKEKKIIL